MVSAWSIGTAKRSTDQKQAPNPGPGAYNPDKKQKVSPPGWKIGSGQRANMIASSNPGPGAYQSKDFIASNGIKYSIAAKCGKKEEVLKVPGPGAYDPRPQSAFVKSPQYSMGSRTQSDALILNKKTPGPGNYEFKSSVDKQPSMKFPKSNRDDLYKLGSTPGPGVFGTSQRLDLNSNTKAPGPGQYNLKSSIELSKGITMISRRTNLDNLESGKVPGPGAYNPNAILKKSAPSYKIGSSSRSELNRELLKTPGPGTYQPRLVNRPFSPAYKLGTDLRRPLGTNDNTPGPGNYNPPSKFIEGPKFSFKGVTSIDPATREKINVPGPGQYNQDSQIAKERPQSAKIGTSNRPDFLKSRDTPGPGNYQPVKKVEGPSWGFGTSKRPEQKRGDEPGPGNYNVPAAFADVPKYLLNSSQKK